MRAVLVALNARFYQTNPAVRLLAARLAACGHETHIVEDHTGRPLCDTLRRVEALAPQAVGLSCYVWNAPEMARLAADLRQLLPNALLVAGGPQCADAERFLAECPVDCAVCGPGEEALPMLLSARERAEAVPRVVSVPPLPPMGDGYRADEDLTGRIAYLETSRGCPYACAYCLSARETGVQALDAQATAALIRAHRSRGARVVKLVDRTFNADPQRARAVWRELGAEDGSPVHFEVGAHLLAEEDAEALRGVPEGRFRFEVGVQSTDERALRAVHRAPNWPQVRRGLALLRERTAVTVHADLIAGLPGETLQGFGRSFDEVYALRPHELQLGFLKILPGAPMEAIARERGYRCSPNPPYEVIATDALTYRELCALHDVEETLNWLRLYPAAEALLLGACAPSAFAAVHALALGLRAQDAFARPLAQNARAQALCAAAPPDVPRDALSDALAFDFYRLGAPGRAPDFMPAPVYGEAQIARLMRAASAAPRARVLPMRIDPFALMAHRRLQPAAGLVMIEDARAVFLTRQS